MKRNRRKLYPKLTLLVALFVLLSPFQLPQAKERPNVLFLCIDDLNTWLLSDPARYTGKVIAPSILKLASEGVLFKKAYTASPKCSPSRTAVLSGVAPWKSGIYQNAQNISESPALKKAIPLPLHFKNQGYSIVSAGKVSHGYDIRHLWDKRLPHKRDPAPPNAPLSPIGRGEKDWGTTHLKESEMNDSKYADFAITELKRKHDKPFFIACGLFHPHYPWYVPQKYLDLYPLDKIVLPKLKEDDLEDIPEEGIGLANPSTHEKIIRAKEYKKALQGYLASTTYADAQIGRILAALEESPHKENTIVIFWSDHGFHLGEKKHWAKSTLWEEATHSNLIVKVPGLTQPKQVCNRLVSLLDIYPTLVELCDLPSLSQFDGNSLVPLLKDPIATWDKPAITGFLDMWKLDVHLTVRTENFRYIRYGRGGQEFYHRKNDPHEWVNQIDNPKYKIEIQRHIDLLPKTAEPLPYKKRGERKSKPKTKKTRSKKKATSKN